MAIVGNTGILGKSKKRWNEVVKDNLKKCGLGKDSERWKLKIFMGNTSDLCEHG